MLSGIVAVQVGYPLPDGLQGLSHCITPDRVTGLAFSSVPHGEDKHVGELVFVIRDVTEGRALAMVLTECDPVSEDLVFGLLGFGSDRLAGEFERSAEIRVEACSGVRCSCSQGCGCGYC